MKQVTAGREFSSHTRAQLGFSKPVNANPGLIVNRIIVFLCSLRLFKFKVTVDLQRPNFAKFFFFAPDIAKIVIYCLVKKAI